MGSPPNHSVSADVAGGGHHRARVGWGHTAATAPHIDRHASVQPELCHCRFPEQGANVGGLVDHYPNVAIAPVVADDTCLVSVHEGRLFDLSSEALAQRRFRSLRHPLAAVARLGRPGSGRPAGWWPSTARTPYSGRSKYGDSRTCPDGTHAPPYCRASMAAWAARTVWMTGGNQP